MKQPDDAWLAWQRDHAAALAALQEAQRAYHRSVVGAVGGQESAVGGEPSTRRAQLDALDAARIRLDDVRTRRPG